MATRHEQVMEMVARELEQNPDIDAGELYTRAAEIDPSIRELDRRQFNARYPLQVKRLRAAARGDGGAAKPAAPRPSRRRKSQAKGKTQAAPRQRRAAAGVAPSREKVRGVFLDFARDFANAESRSEIVNVLGDLDRYVDRIVGKPTEPAGE